jgi:hypothetical protein
MFCRPFLPPCLLVAFLSLFACINSACMMVETHPRLRKQTGGSQGSFGKVSNALGNGKTQGPPSAESGPTYAPSELGMAAHPVWPCVVFWAAGCLLSRLMIRRATGAAAPRLLLCVMRWADISSTSQSFSLSTPGNPCTQSNRSPTAGLCVCAASLACRNLLHGCLTIVTHIITCDCYGAGAHVGRVAESAPAQVVRSLGRSLSSNSTEARELLRRVSSRFNGLLAGYRSVSVHSDDVDRHEFGAPSAPPHGRPAPLALRPAAHRVACRQGPKTCVPSL